MSRPVLRRRRRLLRSTILAALGVLAGAAPAGAYPGFYTPPSPLPDAPPGTVIRSEPVSYSHSWTKPPRGTRIWRMLYTSENALGDQIAVSGALYHSQRYGLSAQRRPLVAYALGSQGTGDRCAPSRRINNGGVQDFLVINILLDRGYDVVVSDYEGLGTPGDHAYAVNLSAAHTVLDMVRAARNFAPAGLSSQAPTVVYGYSQGGGAAGMTAELQPSYAPDVPLQGVAAGGVIADPYAAGQSLDGGQYAGYLFAAAVGYDATYPELQLAQYLNERGTKERASTILDLCFDDILSTYKGFHISDVTTTNPLDAPAWRTRLADNALGKSAPPMPVYLFHSRSDEVLPFAATAKLRQQWCAEGATVEWHPYSGLKHLATAIVGLPDALRWIDQRLRGRSAPGDCPKA
ncbi:MAG: lipase family protein [Patulibacter sp.]